MVPNNSDSKIEKRPNESAETTAIVKKPKLDSGHESQISNHTVYVKNIDNKLSDKLVQDNLLTMFMSYGDVISLNYPNKGKLRGQAWVTMSNADEASQAVRFLNGQELLGKEINLEISSNKSNIIKRLENLL